jgi:hypothetical protein
MTEVLLESFESHCAHLRSCLDALQERLPDVALLRAHLQSVGGWVAFPRGLRSK